MIGHRALILNNTIFLIRFNLNGSQAAGYARQQIALLSFWLVYVLYAIILNHSRNQSISLNHKRAIIVSGKTAKEKPWKGITI
jgi:hypothetical protein